MSCNSVSCHPILAISISKQSWVLYSCWWTNHCWNHSIYHSIFLTTVVIVSFYGIEFMNGKLHYNPVIIFNAYNSFVIFYPLIASRSWRREVGERGRPTASTLPCYALLWADPPWAAEALICRPQKKTKWVWILKSYHRSVEKLLALCSNCQIIQRER